MPAVIAFLLRAIGVSIIPWGWKMLRGLGFAAISYVGIKAGLDTAKDYVFSSLSSTPANYIMVLGMLKIDVCMNILFSAYAARAVLRGMNSSGTQTNFKMGGGS